MATHHPQHHPHARQLHHHPASPPSSSPSSSDFIPNSDHLYLSPKFYENNNNESGKHSTPGATLSSTKANGNLPNPMNPAAIGVQRKLFEERDDNAGGGSKNTNNARYYPSRSENGKRLYASIEDDEGDYDEEEEEEEDSNDAKSCSSSSGCSSSSNSVAGSVNRHLSLKSLQYQNKTTRLLEAGHNNQSIAPTVFSTSQSSSSNCYNKDLTPKKVKRRLEWNSCPEIIPQAQPQPVVSSSLMPAMNGKKKISIRTFKLTNAMKQSLVAAGCNTAAVAAVTANLQNLKNNEKGGGGGGGGTRVVAAHGSSVSMSVSPMVVSGQSPTAFAIVNNQSPKPINIVSSSGGMVGHKTPNRAMPVVQCSPSSSPSQAVFKTPLAPKSAGVAAASDSPNSIFVVSPNGNLIESKLGSARAQPLKPVLASSCLATSANFARVNGKNGSNKRARTARASVSRYDESEAALTASCFFSPSDLLSQSSSSSSPCYDGKSTPTCLPAAPAARTRYETSLGQLTRKFITLLQESSDGSINLNDASVILQVQKRRIYDITNVLEGVGLLHKTYKNKIQLRGGLKEYFCGTSKSPAFESAAPAAATTTTASRRGDESNYRNRKPPPLSLLFSEKDTPANAKLDKARAHKNALGAAADHCYDGLVDHIADLENDENRLDNLLRIVNADSARIKQEYANQLYVTYLDLREIDEFAHQTVIGIRPPMDTTLEVPDPSETLQIWLKNQAGKMIEVYLCPQYSNEGEVAKFNVNVATDDTSIANLKRKKAQPEMMKTEIKVEDDEEEDMRSSATRFSDLDSGYSSTKSNAFSSVSAAGSSCSSSTLSHAMVNDEMTCAGGGGGGAAHMAVASSEQSYDVEDSLLSSSSLYEDYETGMHSDYVANSSELSSQLDDYNVYTSSGGVHMHTDDYRSRVLSPFESTHYSPLISLELQATDDYDFNLQDHEGIADLFGDFD